LSDESHFLIIERLELSIDDATLDLAREDIDDLLYATVKRLLPLTILSPHLREQELDEITTLLDLTHLLVSESDDRFAGAHLVRDHAVESHRKSIQSGLDQLLGKCRFRIEVIVDDSFGDPGACGYLIHARTPISALADDAHRGVEQEVFLALSFCGISHTSHITLYRNKKLMARSCLRSEESISTSQSYGY